MGKCYNFMFDSLYNAGGTNNKKRIYTTNWDGVLPLDKSFKVSFSFVSETDDLAVINFTNVPILRCNLGQSNTYANLSTNATAFSTSNALGFLRLVPMPSNNVAATVDEGYLLAEMKTNPPIYLLQRPSNSTLEVEIHDGLSNTNYVNSIPEYVLTIHFEEINE
jgi:hypothetical protein